MIDFIEKGEGKDLLFLHGYLSCKESFYPQIEYFSRYYKVTAFDFPGFGRSEGISSPWSVSDYADRTEQFLKERGIVFPHVIAHSFGGRVAIKMLSRGECFDRAVLCGCAGIILKRGLSYRLRVRSYRIVKKVAPKFAQKHFGSEEYKTLSPIMRESYKKIVNEDLREDAKKITRPVLFINGERDGATPPASAKIYASQIEGSRREIFANCGHFAHLDNTLLFNLTAEEFFHEL